jgi:hypothetical protein
MNYNENTLKKIYHGIYKINLHSLRFSNRKLFENKKESIIEAVLEPILEPILEYPNKILFETINNQESLTLIKNIYNIEIINSPECKNDLNSKYISFFNLSISYKIIGANVIIYYN